MSRRSIQLLVVLVAVCAAALPASYGLCYAGRMRAAYIRTDALSYEEYADAVRLASDYGAVLRHCVYPCAAMGEIPEGSEVSIAALPGVVGVFVGPLKRADMAAFGPRELHVAKAYNVVYHGLRYTGADGIAGAGGAGAGAGEGGSEGGTGRPAGEITGAGEEVRIDPGPLRIPDEYLPGISGAAYGADAAAPAPPATSEYFLGNVAVGVIMPESDGVGTHDWSDAEEEKMVEEVISAMDYWARHAPENNLYFTYEINYRVPVKVEPLDRGGWTIEDKWAGQSLESLGFHGSNHFDQSYAYIGEMRKRYGADWGFIIFLLHGKTGQSFGSFLAYAYLGGPFNVNVSSNGSVGPENLDRVIAHETGHIFYTLDEYRSSPDDCSARSGYLDVENANKVDGGSACKLNTPCIMRGADRSVGIDLLPPCVYTRGQVGWWDSDDDGVPDVLDTDPTVEAFALDAEESGAVFAGDTLYSGRAVFSGEAASAPLPSRNVRSEVSPRDIAVEPVSAEYRLDGGDWVPCEPSDGRFDGAREPFRFALSGLAPWCRHTVEVRSVTEHGNVTPEEGRRSIEFFSVPALGEEAVVLLACTSPARPPVEITFAPGGPSGRGGASVPVDLGVYDAMGRRIATLASGDFIAGKYYVAHWDGIDCDGRRMPAGVYFVGMSSAGDVAAERIVIVP